MDASYTRWTMPIGRVLLCLVYLRSGLGNLLNWSGTAEYIATKVRFLPSDLLLLGAVGFALAGAALVAVGLFARAGAALLIIFTVLTLIYFHAYWEISDAAERHVQELNFWRNVGLTGGLLIIVAVGAGPISVDSWRQRRRAKAVDRPQPASSPRPARSARE